MITTWSKDELRSIAEADDLHISPFREDGVKYGTPTWIWSVAVDNALYVRAYNGLESRWYQAAVRQKAGRIIAAGMTKEVTFEPVDGSINDRIDNAYRAKYHDSSYLGPMIGAGARSADSQGHATRGVNGIDQVLLRKAHLAITSEDGDRRGNSAFGAITHDRDSAHIDSQSRSMFQKPSEACKSILGKTIRHRSFLNAWRYDGAVLTVSTRALIVLYAIFSSLVQFRVKPHRSASSLRSPVSG